MTIKELINRQLGELPNEIETVGQCRQLAFVLGITNWGQLPGTAYDTILKQEQSRRELLERLIETYYEKYVLLYITGIDPAKECKEWNYSSIELIEKTLSLSWDEIINALEDNNEQ